MSEEKIMIRRETKEDYRKVEILTREAFEQYEATFPPKQKQKLPGQLF